MEKSMSVPQKIKNGVTRYPKILSIEPKVLNVRSQRDICIPMFIELFTTAKGRIITGLHQYIH